MKVILTEKITKLGNIGDTVEVKTGYARNYLLPNGKAMRFTRENVALFEAKKAELQARQDAAKETAENSKTSLPTSLCSTLPRLKLKTGKNSASTLKLA